MVYVFACLFAYDPDVSGYLEKHTLTDIVVIWIFLQQTDHSIISFEGCLSKINKINKPNRNSNLTIAILPTHHHTNNFLTCTKDHFILKMNVVGSKERN